MGLWRQKATRVPVKMKYDLEDTLTLTNKDKEIKYTIRHVLRAVVREYPQGFKSEEGNKVMSRFGLRNPGGLFWRGLFNAGYLDRASYTGHDSGRGAKYVYTLNPDINLKPAIEEVPIGETMHDLGALTLAETYVKETGKTPEELISRLATADTNFIAQMIGLRFNNLAEYQKRGGDYLDILFKSKGINFI